MTGEEFNVALTAAGYSKEAFAEKMNVHPSTIYRLCESSAVAVKWQYALAGLACSRKSLRPPKVEGDLLKLLEQRTRTQLKNSPWYKTAPAPDKRMGLELDLNAVEQRDVRILVGDVDAGSCQRTFVRGSIALGKRRAEILVAIDFASDGIIVNER
ncbi:hypothetical protein [Herbaspirillum huttiense]|uniref:hypothetical protein n=1 Tax=Herbaspirillum huttiense TaxID=863372 RepID=UPI0039AEC636